MEQRESAQAQNARLNPQNPHRLHTDFEERSMQPQFIERMPDLEHVGSSFPQGPEESAESSQRPTLQSLETTLNTEEYQHVPYYMVGEDYADSSEHMDDSSLGRSNNSSIFGHPVSGNLTLTPTSDQPDDMFVLNDQVITAPDVGTHNDQAGRHRCHVELPDLFHAHDPAKYKSYKWHCSKAYSNFHGFLRHSLRKHRSRGNVQREGITSEKFNRALRIKCVRRGLSLEEREIEQWKLVRRVLFGTPENEPIPECPDKGTHDIIKAKCTQREKKIRSRGTSPMSRSGSCMSADDSYSDVDPSTSMQDGHDDTLSPVSPLPMSRCSSSNEITSDPVPLFGIPNIAVPGMYSLPMGSQSASNHGFTSIEALLHPPIQELQEIARVLGPDSINNKLKSVIQYLSNITDQSGFNQSNPSIIVSPPGTDRQQGCPQNNNTFVSSQSELHNMLGNFDGVNLIPPMSIPYAEMSQGHTRHVARRNSFQY